MMSWKQAFIISWVFLAGTLTAFICGYWLHEFQSEQNTLDLSLVQEVYNLLQQHAYNGLPDAKVMEYGMIEGLVTTLNDPYTNFLEPATHELQSQDLQGEFGGIGVRLERNLENQVILFPYPLSPAENAGVRDGDILLRVDGIDILPEVEEDTIQAALRGPVGEKVEIQIELNGNDRQPIFSITRIAYAIPSVSSNLDPDEPRLGVIQVSLMSATTRQEIESSVRNLQTQGATHFVLDLRGNRGGLLNTGVDVARLFLEEGAILEQQYKNHTIETFRVQEPGSLSDIPLAIIVDGGTASAAEILAGALQVHQRAIVVGQSTFGKDSLQLVFELSDHSSLHVTAGKWWVPGLDSTLSQSGLIPDILIPDGTQETKPEIQSILKQFFEH